MSIQDDIFDVENELENLFASRGTQDQFERIVRYIGQLETRLGEYKEFYEHAQELAFAIDKIRKQEKT